MECPAYDDKDSPSLVRYVVVQVPDQHIDTLWQLQGVETTLSKCRESRLLLAEFHRAPWNGIPWRCRKRYESSPPVPCIGPRSSRNCHSSQNFPRESGGMGMITMTEPVACTQGNSGDSRSTPCLPRYVYAAPPFSFLGFQGSLRIPSSPPCLSLGLQAQTRNFSQHETCPHKER